MNIYNIFPKELWISIILEIPYKYILNLYDVNDQFKYLCDTEDLLNKRKLLGFPRSNGHYKCHDISQYCGSFYNTKNVLVNGRSNKLLLQNRYSNNEIYLILSVLFDKLYENDIDLIAGDLLDTKGIKMILLFDGETIVNITNVENNGTINNNKKTIPKHLCPIKNKLSIEYWDNSLLTCSNFMFDIRDIRKELIENISHNEHGVMYTWFILNKKPYVIFQFNENLFEDTLLNENDIYLYIKSYDVLFKFFKVKGVVVENVYHGFTVC